VLSNAETAFLWNALNFSYVKGTVSRNGERDEPREPIGVKTGSPDLADFALTRLLFPRLWQFAQWLGNCWHIVAITA
jgi:hypothetical protein